MRAELITIGDEILIGQIADTNSQWMGVELGKIGVSVARIHSISDHRQEILDSLSEVYDRADLVIITGGLGPTKDDITKKTLADFFQDELKMDQEILDHVKAFFAKHNYPFTRLNNGQALMPQKAQALMNHWGTAPGMWFEQGGKVVVSLPGVPYEMKQLMTHEVLPRIKSRYKLPIIIHRNIMTYGMGESMLAEEIEAWEEALPDYISLAYLPSLGSLKLRLTARGEDRNLLEETLDHLISDLHNYIGKQIVGYQEEETLEAAIGELLKTKGQNLATAESCTGGMIAEMITAVPGASGYFKGGLVAYNKHIKIHELGVDERLIDKYSVVSAQVAEAMAEGIRKKFNTDYAIATTGNAGPTTDETDETLGVVYISIAYKSGVYSEKFSFGQPRERVIKRASNKGLELLKQIIIKNKEELFVS